MKPFKQYLEFPCESHWLLREAHIRAYCSAINTRSKFYFSNLNRQLCRAFHGLQNALFHYYFSPILYAKKIHIVRKGHASTVNRKITYAKLLHMLFDFSQILIIDAVLFAPSVTALIIVYQCSYLITKAYLTLPWVFLVAIRKILI